MVVTPPAHQEFETALLQRLSNSQRFKAYQNAFRTATGLPLWLISADPDGHHTAQEETYQRASSEPLALGPRSEGMTIGFKEGCEADRELDGKAVCQYFAELSATAVPVTLGASVIGFLKTGEIFSETPSEDQFEAVLGTIGRKALDKKVQATLKTVYFETRQAEPRRYQSMVSLLHSFAVHLSQHADSIAIPDGGREPGPIAKARKYIHARLDQPLSLGQIAHHVGLSESHFCRLFKDTVGVTLTDYINRCRVHWAKRELLRPGARISEIAFLVGYQSLSQFNRSFVKITGLSPTSYRRQRLGRPASDG